MKSRAKKLIITGAAGLTLAAGALPAFAAAHGAVRPPRPMGQGHGAVIGGTISAISGETLTIAPRA